MDAVEFLKEKNRMCREYGTLENDCYTCPLGNDSGGCQAGVAENQIVAEEDLVQIVEKWSKEHPIKTRQSEFLKMFPDVRMHSDHIDICPKTVDTKSELCDKYDCECSKCKKEYWLAEVGWEKERMS